MGVTQRRRTAVCNCTSAVKPSHVVFHPKPKKILLLKPVAGKKIVNKQLPAFGVEHTWPVAWR
jgi:hypothetical protein